MPADDLKVMHVAGTKGKGSVCSFAASILTQHGLKTGLYTSPHLVTVRVSADSLRFTSQQVTERIQINGRPIPNADFARIFWECWDRLTSSKVMGR